MRLVGALIVVVSAVAWSWITDPTRFPLDEQQLRISGLVHTPAATVRERIGLPVGSTPNLFSLPTADMERRLLELPAVARAEVRVVLPDSLVVAVSERVPVLVWRTADRAFLVDAAGVLIGDAMTAGPLAPLAIVHDRRSQPVEGPVVGDTLGDIERSVTLRLAAVTAELVGSSAERLELFIEEEEGYVLAATPTSWRAIFGHYTPTLRSPDMIDQQVQCLRSLLATGEAAVLEVRLAVADDRCGTYRPRPTGPGP
ncbi:hypothetical protein BH24CHL7_BH24CHL7_10310 [soil metagenome]